MSGSPLPTNDLERVLFFETARKTAEVNHAKNPTDAENLTRWGGALLELSQFQQGQNCIKMIQDAILKFEAALEINPTKAETLWCLGNAHTSHAFLISDHARATEYFKLASGYFQQAIDEDPENELYIKSLELSNKAPELHLEVHSQAAQQQAALEGQYGSKRASKKKKGNSDLTYDIFGWVILAVGIIAWVGMAKSHVPPPPPSPSR